MKIIVIGVCKDDIIYKGIIYDKINFTESEIKVCYDKVPKTLVNWPNRLTIKCWNCRKLIEGRPIPIPIRYDKEMIIKGVACDVACAKTYILTYKDPDINQKEIFKHMSLLLNCCEKLGIAYLGVCEKEHFYIDEGFGY